MMLSIPQPHASPHEEERGNHAEKTSNSQACSEVLKSPSLCFSSACSSPSNGPQLGLGTRHCPKIFHISSPPGPCDSPTCSQDPREELKTLAPPTEWQSAPQGIFYASLLLRKQLCRPTAPASNHLDPLQGKESKEPKYLALGAEMEEG